MNFFVEDRAKQGLLIRGGSDCGLGIYIAGVDVGGAADQAGLKVCCSLGVYDHNSAV